MQVRALTAVIFPSAGRRVLGRCQLHTSRVCWALKKVLRKFNLADIGEGITECEVIKWNVTPPSRLTCFDLLCEVQSDKASVEITSPYDGVLKELLVQEGEVAKVGQGLCLIEVEEEEKEGAGDSQRQGSAGNAVPSSASQDPPLQTGEPKTAPQRQPHPLDPSASQETNVFAQHPPSSVLATPSVRHLARQHGIDLEKLAPGSGKGGRIEKKDIDAYLAAGQPQPPGQVEADLAGEEVVELGRTRYGMWKAMTKSLEIPHFGYSTSLDLTAFHALLPVLNKHIPSHYIPPSSKSHPKPPLVSPTGVYGANVVRDLSPKVLEGGHFSRLTYLPFLLKTLSKAMMEWPLFRSSITPVASGSAASAVTGPAAAVPEKPTLTIRPHPAISIALTTPTGLYTPTLTCLHTASIYDIASSLSRLSFLGRQVPCGLTVKDMPKRGGTITVSNVGAIGKGEWANPVLVPGGGVAIAAIGRASWVWDVHGDHSASASAAWDGKPVRKLKVGVSWSADHRIVEGAELAAFVECWRSWVEHPERMIGEGI